MAAEFVIPFIPIIDFPITTGPIVLTESAKVLMLERLKQSFPILARAGLSVTQLNPYTLAITAIVGGIIYTIAVVNFNQCCPECLPGQVVKPPPICCETPPTITPPPPVSIPVANFRWMEKRTIYRFVSFRNTSTTSIPNFVAVDDECLMHITSPVAIDSANANPLAMIARDEKTCASYIGDGFVPPNTPVSFLRWELDRDMSQITWMSQAQRNQFNIPRAANSFTNGDGRVYTLPSNQLRFMPPASGVGPSLSNQPFPSFSFSWIFDPFWNNGATVRVIREQYTAFEIYSTTTNNATSTRTVLRRGNVRLWRDDNLFQSNCGQVNRCCGAGESLFRFTFTLFYTNSLGISDGTNTFNWLFEPLATFTRQQCASNLILGTFDVPEFDIGFNGDSDLRINVQNNIARFILQAGGALRVRVRVERI